MQLLAWRKSPEHDWDPAIRWLTVGLKYCSRKGRSYNEAALESELAYCSHLKTIPIYPLCFAGSLQAKTEMRQFRAKPFGYLRN